MPATQPARSGIDLSAGRSFRQAAAVDANSDFHHFFSPPLTTETSHAINKKARPPLAYAPCWIRTRPRQLQSKTSVEMLLPGCANEIRGHVPKLTLFIPSLWLAHPRNIVTTKRNFNKRLRKTNEEMSTTPLPVKSSHRFAVWLPF